MKFSLSPDSMFMRGMSRVADLVLLNLLFLLTSIPLITIGPSAAALYSVVFAFGTEREDGVIRQYFKSFRECFRSAFLAWLLIAVVAVILLLDIFLMNWLGGMAALATVLFQALLGIELLIACMVFPLQSRFQNSVYNTVRNALILGFAHLPRSVVMLVIWLFPAYLFFRMPLMFFYTGFIWVVIYFAFAAYMSSLLLRRVFAPFLSKEE